MPLSDKEYLQINQALFSLVNAYDRRLMLEQKNEKDALTVSERGVMLVLGQKGPLNQRQLANVMQLSPGPVSQYVQKLVIKQYIQKEQDETDRRNWWLHLTPTGRQVYQDTVNGAVLYTGDLLHSLDTDQKEQLKELLLKISHDLGYDW